MDQVQPVPSAQPVSPQVSTVIPDSKPKNHIFVWIVVGVIILGIGITGGLFLSKQLYPTPQITPTPSPISQPPTLDPTANWKTYTNVSDGYLLKYPNDWIVQTLTDVKDKFYSFDALGKEMILSKTILGKNGYQMIIFRNFSGPISEEPQICVYPDSQIDSGTYAPLRFTSDIVTEIRDGGYRRSILNEYPDQIRFEVCKPRKNPSADGIIFEPAYITYLTPKKYDFQTLNEMDQILSTFSFVEDPSKKTGGTFCGGFAGTVCPEGYKCQLEGNYPDASGTCIKKRL